MPSYYSKETKRRIALAFLAHRDIKRVARMSGVSEATVRRAVKDHTLYRFNYRKMYLRKLNDMEVRFIRRAAGRLDDIHVSDLLRISVSGIYRIRNGETYKEV